MHFEDSFGSRQSPSLAEAMRQTPQLGQQWVYSSGGSTPNSITQSGIKLHTVSSSQQVIEPILRCSPTIIEPAYNSQPNQIAPSIDPQSLDEIEKKLCQQLDETLKMNYKKMKNKIKKVKSRVHQTDCSIHRIQELVESVYEQIDEIETANESISMHQIPHNNCPVDDFLGNSNNNDNNNNNYNYNYNQGQKRRQKKITWRKGLHKNNHLPLFLEQQPQNNDLNDTSTFL
ncbi:hypothetical protein M9Y10_011910 [Tritrichomonas musculus]|uniref:Uncharacterized protein n=1 Tax=Tritrichomonas musculus TaxID=1915356 RepID=A0ABR2IB88_9EUKA